MTTYLRPLTLALLLVPYFIFMGAGHVDAVDAEPSLRTARNIVKKGSFFVEEVQGDPLGWVKNKEKGYITKLGIGMPILYLPFAYAITFLPSSFQSYEELIFEFLASFTNALLMSVLLAFIFHFCTRQGFSPLQSLFLTLGLGFCTYLLAYAKTMQRDVAQALCLTIGFGYYQRYLFTKQNRHLFYSGSALAFGFLVKSALIIPMLPLFLISFFKIKEHKKRMAFFYTPFLVGLFIWFLFAHFGYGHLTYSGYSSSVTNLKSHVWSTPFLLGLYKQWISPINSFFFFNLFLLPSLYFFWKDRYSLDLFQWSCLTALLIQSCFYARWFSPMGGPALGPRFLVATTPLFILALKPKYLEFKDTLKVKLVLSTFFTLLLLNSLVQSSIKTHQYWNLQKELGPHTPYPHWLANYKFFYHKLFFNDERYLSTDFGSNKTQLIDLGSHRTLLGFNYWWLHLPRALPHLPLNRINKPLPHSQSVGKMDQRGQNKSYHLSFFSQTP